MDDIVQIPAHENCFVCDPSSPVGIGIVWFGRKSNGSIFGDITLDDRHQGPPAHAHGGILSALFDDAMGTCAWFNRNTVMTGRMTVNYRRPVPLNRPIHIEAHVVEKKGRKVYVQAELVLEDGIVAADSEGLFIEIPGLFEQVERFKEMKAFAEQLKVAGSLPHQEH